MIGLYLAPLDLFREAQSGGKARETVLNAYGKDVPPLVATWLQGGAEAHGLTKGLETVQLFEELGERFGEPMPLDTLSGLRSAHIEAVDQALTLAGLPSSFRLEQLLMAGAPTAGLPRPNDYPFVGYVKADVLDQVAPRFADGKLTNDNDNVDGVFVDLESAFELRARAKSETASPLGWLGTYFM